MELNAVLKKVQNLLDLADRDTTPPAEAANARAKAEAMMLKYRIEESQLAEQAEVPSFVPIVHQMRICPWLSPFRQQYYSLAYWIANHAGVRVVLKSGTDNWLLEMVGYESDIRYAEMLYTSARTIFGARLEPAVDPKLNDMQNVYRLRNAGIERNRIAQMMWGLDTHAAHAKVGKLYKLACEELSEDAVVAGRRVNAKTYRKEYADQFVTTMYLRLSEARNAADSPAGTLVLASRSEKVDEAFYERYPDHRPRPTDPNAKPAKARKPRRLSITAYERELARRNSPAVIAGQERGKAAASEVPLAHVARAQRIEDDNQWVDRNFREITS